MKKTSKPAQPRLHQGVTGSAITVHVLDSAPETALDVVLPDGTIQVRLKGKSSAASGNTALLVYLAQVLGISISQCELVAGRDGVDKLIAISNLDAPTVHQRVMECLRHISRAASLPG